MEVGGSELREGGIGGAHGTEEKAEESNAVWIQAVGTVLHGAPIQNARRRAALLSKVSVYSRPWSRFERPTSQSAKSDFCEPYACTARSNTSGRATTNSVESAIA